MPDYSFPLIPFDYTNLYQYDGALTADELLAKIQFGKLQGDKQDVLEMDFNLKRENLTR